MLAKSIKSRPSMAVTWLSDKATKAAANQERGQGPETQREREGGRGRKYQKPLGKANTKNGALRVEKQPTTTTTTTTLMLSMTQPDSL